MNKCMKNRVPSVTSTNWLSSSQTWAVLQCPQHLSRMQRGDCPNKVHLSVGFQRVINMTQFICGAASPPLQNICDAWLTESCSSAHSSPSCCVAAWEETREDVKPAELHQADACSSWPHWLSWLRDILLRCAAVAAPSIGFCSSVSVGRLPIHSLSADYFQGISILRQSLMPSLLLCC